MASVGLDKLIEHMDFKELTPDIDVSTVRITISEINRPALQLTGYYEDFSNERVQVIGNVEYGYLMRMDAEKRNAAYEEILSKQIPCIIFTNSNKPTQDMLRIAEKHNVPTFGSASTTSECTAELIRWLGTELAPSMAIHGVLVDVFGEGVLILGESGIGKSEAALELIKRGHRLVSDDVVNIARINDVTLIGSAPDITRHFIELRGIGIIDVKTLFGVGSVEQNHSIDLVIKLVEWDKDTEYDRLGLENDYTELLGNSIVSHEIPIRPGRNLAIIVETAAINRRQKSMGYNAAQELYNRVQRNILEKRRD